jgi:hypothetical protein
LLAEDLAHPGSMLCGLAVVAQAAITDGHLLDAFSPFDDGPVASEVDVCGRQIAKAFVVAPVIVVIDKGADLTFEIAGQEVVLQQNAVLQSLMPAFDLALRLGMVRCGTHMVDTIVIEPACQIAGLANAPATSRCKSPMWDFEIQMLDDRSGKFYDF